MDSIIFGCGSQARYVIDNLQSQSLAAPLGMVDLEGNTQVGQVINEVPVSWTYQQALEAIDQLAREVIVAHGDNALKMKVAKALEERGFRFLTAQHRQAIVSPTAGIGEGCIINAGAVLMPNVCLERHVIVHSGCVIEHDCILHAGANIAPGANLAGRVRVGRQAYLYTGCSIIPGVEIGERAVVGAGAVVLADVPAEAYVVGNPARRIR